MEASSILNDPQFERAVERIIRRLTLVDPWLAPKQMAEHAGVSKDHVLRALRAGAIEHVGEGKLIRARQSAIDHWLANTKKKEPAQ